jgi:UDP-glucose 4-epimerase
MRALVTGGAGFIGHHLVARLLERGHDVSVIDDFSTGFQWRVAPHEGSIRLVEGTVLDPEALDRAGADCDVIFHEAAIPSVARSLIAPRLTNDVNVNGTIEVMLAAARLGVKRVVLAASSSAYGAAEQLPCRETQSPAPLSPYAASKLAAEYYLHTLGVVHDVATVALRYFNVFGPGQDPDSEYSAVVPKFTTAVLGQTRPTVNGAGDISRDFTFIDNVVEANLLAAAPTARSGLTCNIGCGARYSLLDLLQAIADAAGTRVDPIFGPPRPGDVPHSLADISVARRELGYEVLVPFAEGVARTVAWYGGHPSGRGDDPPLAAA